MYDIVYITVIVILIVIVVCTAIYCEDLKDRIDTLEYLYLQKRKNAPNEAGTSVEREYEDD